MGSNKNYLAFTLHKGPRDLEWDSIDVLFCVVAGNGVRVCYHGDWTWSSPTTLRRQQLDRNLSFWWPLTSKTSLLPQCTTSELWTRLEIICHCSISVISIWRCTMYWGTTFQLPGNFNSWRHGLMSNSRLQVIVVALHQKKCCDFNTTVWCSSYNSVLLIHKHAFSLSSFVDHAWKGSLGTRLD